MPDWNHLPPIIVATPVLALAAAPQGLWASGPGGVAWLATGGEWSSRISGLPLTDVAALVYTGGWLIAGGAEGIARSIDGGLTWQRADVEGEAVGVAAIVGSPQFREDTTLLAAMLGGGIVRSDDAGRSWKPATFGLEAFEVTALAWRAGEHVLAATTDGVYRSPNAGRAWRVAVGSEGLVIAALAFLPDGSALAAQEIGGLLHSTDGGVTWEPWGNLVGHAEATALHVTPEGAVLLGTTGGVLRSLDNGATWRPILEQPIFTFAADTNSVYAGTAEGIVGIWADMASNPELPEWHALDRPPLHDLRRLTLLGSQVLVSGIRSVPLHYTGTTWRALVSAPLPLTALAIGPNATLWASSPDGLFCSSNAGEDWQTAISGANGQSARISFRADGVGWAGSADGQRLWMTTDKGTTWRPSQSPFGMLPLAMLQAMPTMVVGGTYDPRRKVAQLWRSFDDGNTWERGAEVQTPWPLIVSTDNPPLIGLDAHMFRQRPQGGWENLPIGDDGGCVRRLLYQDGTLFALTTTGIQRSADSGVTWHHDDDGLPIEQVMDIAIDSTTLYVLLAGGLVWSRAV